MKLSEALKNGIALLSGNDITIVKEMSELEIDVAVIGRLDCDHNQLTSLIINQPIGGGLYCSYNRLTSLIINQPIGGYLDCSNNHLTSLIINQPIGGGLYCSYNRLTSLIINQPIGDWLDCSNNPNLKENPTYQRLMDGDKGDNWIYADGILSHFDKVRHLNDVTFYIGFKYTVAEKDGKYAHGKDMRSALLDLRFKLADRDMSDYEDLTMESLLSYEDAVVMYRVITGACQAGTQAFLDEYNIEDRDYTVKEIIEKTQGQYGSEELRKFFERGETK